MAAATAKATSAISSVARTTTAAAAAAAASCSSSSSNQSPPPPPRLAPAPRHLLPFRDDDFCSSDEIKIFTEEGEEEDKEQITNEELQAALLEEKSSLIQETELGIKQERSSRIDAGRALSDSCPGSPYDGFTPSATSSSSLLPYHLYGNGLPPPCLPPPPHTSLSTSNTLMVRSTGSPLSPSFLYNDSLGSPPPAHLGGIPYSLAADPGIRSLYSMPLHSSYPYSLITPDAAQFSSCSLPRYGSLLHCGLGGEPHMGGGSGGLRCYDDGKPHPPQQLHPPQQQSHHHRQSVREKKHDRNHIKKPLNAFMLYMKEMRPKIVAECTLKESAAINQILGRRWHSLSRDEQAKYYELARKERQLHMQLYPGWSARDNYAQNKKKKRKRMQEKSSIVESSSSGSSSAKKCRGRYGLDQQDMWCKPCNSPPASSSSSSSSPTKDDHRRMTTLSPLLHQHHHPHHHQQQLQQLHHHLMEVSTPEDHHMMAGNGCSIMDMHLNNNCAAAAAAAAAAATTGGMLTLDTILFTSGGGGLGGSSHNNIHQFMSSESGGGGGLLLQESKLLAAAAASAAAAAAATGGNNGGANGEGGGGGENGEQHSPKYISL